MPLSLSLFNTIVQGKKSWFRQRRGSSASFGTLVMNAEERRICKTKNLSYFFFASSFSGCINFPYSDVFRRFCFPKKSFTDSKTGAQDDKRSSCSNRPLMCEVLLSLFVIFMVVFRKGRALVWLDLVKCQIRSIEVEVWPNSNLVDKTVTRMANQLREATSGGREKINLFSQCDAGYFWIRIFN